MVGLFMHHFFVPIIAVSLLLSDVEEVIDMAKRKLEKEREQFMSKSLPSGYSGDSISGADNESESDNDSDDSDEKGELGWKR